MKTFTFRTGLVAATLALAACGASPPLRYHTLTGAAPAAEVPTRGGAALLVEVLPIAIPERVNREEIVFAGTDRTLELHDSERWAAPLADEFRQAIDDALWRRLRAADIYAAPVPTGGGVPQYRLAVRIERLDVIPGRIAVVEGSWTARMLPQGKSAVCRAGFVATPAATNTEASVAALAEGTARLADAVADSFERLESGAADPCAAR